MLERYSAIDPSDFAQSPLGERVGADTLRFVRTFAAPIERVWDAITTVEGLEAWLGRPVAIDLLAGGTFAIAFSDEDRMDGRILEIDPPRRLAIAWHETSNGASSPYGTLDGDGSHVTFELSTEANGGTRLVFTHRYVAGGEPMIGFGAGWHAALAVLRALLAGAADVDRGALYADLKPRYEQYLASAS